MKLFSMASHGYPSGLGAVSLPEKGYGSLSKDFHHVLPYHSNQDLVKSHSINLSHQQKEEKPTCGLLDGDQFVRIDRTSKRPSVVDVQAAHPDSVLLSCGITERLARQEKILKLLASGSIELESGSVDLSMLYDLMSPQQLIADFRHQSLIYPNTVLLQQTSVGLSGGGGRNGCTENSCTGTDMRDVLSVMSSLYLSKNAVKFNNQTMLVPYFEWRKRAHVNTTDALKLATDKDASMKSGKTKEKTSHKKKINVRAGQEREIYGNSYLHAFESLLSIIVDRKHQGKNAIHSLKKPGSKLPQLLIQFSASIAGTGIALVLSILCRVACFKVLSMGLGLGLVCLSWAINKLRNTVISTSSEKEDEMMDNLDTNLKEIYFRAAALMTIVVLKLG